MSAMAGVNKRSVHPDASGNRREWGLKVVEEGKVRADGLLASVLSAW